MKRKPTLGATFLKAFGSSTGTSLSAVIQVDCTTSIWPTSTYVQENVNLLTILHWWKAESTLQDKEMRRVS